MKVQLRLLCFLAPLIFSNCSTLIKSVVNKKLPSSSIEDYKTHAIEKQISNFTQIKRPDFRAHIAEQDLTVNLDSIIQKTFEAKPNFKINFTKSFSLSRKPVINLTQQALYIKIFSEIELKDTVIELNGKKVNLHKHVKKLELSFEGYVSPFTQGNNLVLLPAIENLRIEKIKARCFSPIWVVKPLFNYIFPIIRENLNTYFIQNPQLFSIPLNVKPIPEKLVSELLTKTKSVTIVQDLLIKVSKKIGPVLFRLSPDGMDLIGEFEADVPVNDSNNLIQARSLVENELTTTAGALEFKNRKVYKHELRVAQYHTNQDLENAHTHFSSSLACSNASIYGASYSYASLSKTDVPDLQIIQPFENSASFRNSMLNKVLNNSNKSRPNRKEARALCKQEVPRQDKLVSFNELFNNYSRLFDTLSFSAFDPVENLRRSEISVSKKFVSLLINEIFFNPQLILEFNPDPIDKKAPREPIKIIEKPKFDCASVLTNCGSLMDNCSRHLNNCNFNCKWYKPWCYAAEGACHVSNGVIWSLCQVKNGLVYTGCQVANAAKFSWCTLEFLVSYLAYEALYIGDYQVNAHAELSARFQIDHLAVTEDLSKLDLLSKVTANAKYKIDFDYYSRALGWLVCPGGIHCNFDNNAKAELHDAIQASISAVNRHGLPDSLIITIPQIPIDISTDPLFLQILSRCPQTFITCPIIILGVTVAELVYLFNSDPKLRNYLNVFWQGTYRHMVDEQKIKLEVPSFNLALPNGIKTATSAIGSKSISYIF